MRFLRRPLHWLWARSLPLWLLAWLCFCPAALALAPDKAFTHYVRDSWSIEDGLPQISAIAIAQDRTGYIWIGTQGGLARFDGARFVGYTPSEEPALAGLWVRTLLVDRRGRLWIGTYKGLAREEAGHFTPIPPAAEGIAELDITALAERGDGSIVAGTPDGLFRVEADGGRLHALPGPRPALSLLAHRDSLWVGTAGAVVRVRPDGQQRLPLPAEAAGAAVVRLVAAQGRLWAGTTQGLFALDPAGRWQAVTTGSALDGAPVTAMLADRDGNLWVAANAGLARFRDAALAEFVADRQPGTFRQVISLLEDREGNLWLGSQLEGIARVWNGWTRRYSVAEGLQDQIVWSLSPDPDGRIWVGTNDGLAVLEDGRFRMVVPGAALPHPHAYNLLAEPDRVWIGTRRGLVVWRDGQLEAPAAFAPMAAAQINGIVRAADGSLWFPTSDGLFHWRDGALRRYGQNEGLRDPRVRVIAFDRDGQLLIGTQTGLYRLRDDRAWPLDGEGGLPPGLDVSALHLLGDGRIVVGALDGHLFVRAGGRWHMLGPAQGVPANAPFFITEDARYLWIAGIRGIGRVPLADLPRTARDGQRPMRGEMLLNERGDANAGQQGYCCNGAGMSKGFVRDHVLWLPSRDGVVALDTRAIRKNPVPPILVVERVRTPAGWQDLPAAPGQPLALPADARDLGFEFTALSFQDPHSVQLRYRLRGYDRDWHRIEPGAARSANYTNLPPGDYTFEVAGANNAGVWASQPALLRFAIAPYFQETWLFRALLGALLLVLLYAVYRWQLLRHARQRAQLEAQVQARTLELHAANARLEMASQTDPLTGLRNRRYLANQIPTDIAYYDRQRTRHSEYDQVLVFALVDIDHFKRINDQYGHRAGDQVLLQVAQVLGSLARSSDYLARWGGEEFLLVFRPMAGRHLETIGERVRDAIARHPFDVGNGTQLQLTCSVGLAEYPLFQGAQHGLGWEQVVELADAALYWVKHHGRDGWAAFRPTEFTDRAALIRELHAGAHALLHGARLQLLSSRPQPFEDERT
ncbi:MAG TPA: diguanylate cyclase [Xanthomonadaceae bacterium]|nr:diguanylate cyclase [Xanthomonadaceae bacterium]